METLKAGLTDTAFSFSFRPRTFREKWHDLFDKNTFAKHLPSILAHSGETTESAGKKLSVLPEAWQGIVKGKYYPEKNTVLALALVCHMRPQDTNALLVLSGFSFDLSSVRDVVVEYLLERELFNPRCGTGAFKSTISIVFPLRKGRKEFAANLSLREIFAARKKKLLPPSRLRCAISLQGEAKALFLIRAVKCRCKTLDGKRAGVLKYLQLNEESRCGGKSTAPSP